MFSIHLNADLLQNLMQIYYGIFQWKKFVNRLRVDKIMVMSLWPFFGPPCIFVRYSIVFCDIIIIIIIKGIYIAQVSKGHKW